MTDSQQIPVAQMRARLVPTITHKSGGLTIIFLKPYFDEIKFLRAKFAGKQRLKYPFYSRKAME
jgi:hypothetical protein